MVPRRAYETLLRLYPSDYRVMFSAEMVTAFEEAAEECRRQGHAVFFRFALAEIAGVFRGAITERSGKYIHAVYRWANLIRLSSVSAEWIATLTHAAGHSNSSFRSRCMPDMRMMRPIGVPRELWYGASTIRFASQSDRP
jgi:hypothetical protein